MCHSWEMSYSDAQRYEAGKAYSWRNNRISRLVMLCSGEFDSGIVYELTKNKNDCRIESENYFVIILTLG